MATTVKTQAEEDSSIPHSTYDVLLSFRGKDTRKAFTDHLYTALVNAGFRTFRDDQMERGENIKLGLQEAVRLSRISVVVFSKDYASSSSCLDEVLMIVERRKISKQVVLPVFYDVDPSEVKNQTGGFAEAFARHEQFLAENDERKDEWVDKVNRWRAALKEVADLGGMALQNQADGHEGKFIQKIVKVIEDKLNRKILNLPTRLVGIDSRVMRINSWVQDGSTDVGLFVICGMGGIGKTTIAKFMYNLNHMRFEGSSFLANIREVSKQPNGLVRLQRQLISDILKRKKENIQNVDEGIIRIKDVVSCKRVIIVLDDVDDMEQLDTVAGIRGWFHPGSKIVITTRHERLLLTHRAHEVHKVEKLDEAESFELFSWHAFGQDKPIEGFAEHSKRVVQYCGGIPLALQVLGSSLSGKRVEVWESSLKKLEVIPESQIVNRLKISYHSLQDEHDKNLFLHIACFFVGKDKDLSVKILDECDFYTTVGIRNLIDRCLVTVDTNNKLVMHQLLQDIGREIVRQESPKDPGKRSRLWHNKDSFNVLREKTGTKAIEGLALDMSTLREAKSSQPILSTNNSDRHHFKTDAFARMRKLRLLQLKYVHLSGSYAEFPKGLRLLCWHGYPAKFIPKDFPLEGLVALDMSYSSLKRVWKGTKFLGLLKILNLSHSHGLVKTPDFSLLPNLERLILKDCTSLLKIHESLGNLERLVLLNAKDCKNLRKLPRNIAKLKSLEILIVSGCSNLDNLPPEMGKMESLKVLYADGIAINELLSTTREVKSWCESVWPSVSKPRTAPGISWVSLPQFLVSLSITDCNLSDDAFPRDFHGLHSLQILNLGKNPIFRLPDCIKGLKGLQTLCLNSCTRLESLLDLPSVDTLLVAHCTSLEKITYQSNMFSSLLVEHTECDRLVEIQGVFKLQPIEKFEAEMINDLGFFNLDSMANIEVNFANGMLRNKVKLPIQGLYDLGKVFSTFFPGSEVPGWFRYKTAGSSISFPTPSLNNPSVRGLNLSVVYSLSDSQDTWSSHWNGPEPFLKATMITNDSKALKFEYVPTCFGIPEANEDMIWLSHWSIGEKLEPGDEVNVLVAVNQFFKLKEFGVDVVLHEEEQKRDENCVSPSCSDSTNLVRSGRWMLPAGENDFDPISCPGEEEQRHCHERNPSHRGHKEAVITFKDQGPISLRTLDLYLKSHFKT